MKSKLKNFGALLLAAILAMTITPTFSPEAEGAELYTLTDSGALTNLPATVAAASISNQVSVIPITLGKGLAVQGSFRTASGTSNVVFQWAVSADGTNITTPVWDSTTVVASSTTNIWADNWTADQLTGYQWLVLSGVTNQNAGTLTNYGVRYSIPKS